MPIVMTAVIPASPDMYDAINTEMGITPDNLPNGLIAHYAAPSENGMLIFDVWEAKEASRTSPPASSGRRWRR